ncbi:MAG: Ppx/GppA family phosphatase [Ignavibacteriales bacterium]|nr:Ppx/GppA family phosphatase [Ignavibacteriales bacterium]
MTVASIDIGSNTVLLLIAEVDEYGNIHSKLNLYRAPRISKGLTGDRNISEKKISELKSVLSEYSTVIKDYHCQHVYLVGTNALRIANNSSEVIKKIKNDFGWDIKIISGDEEARLSFLGATYHLKSLETKIVFDIGGGSTEIIIGNDSTITFKKSFHTGVVSLTEKFLKQNPPANEEIFLANDWLKKLFAEIRLDKAINYKVIAVAGTPTTLSCIKQKIKIYDEKLVDDSFLTINDVREISLRLSKMKSEQIAAEFGQVVEGREDVLFAGTLILINIMNLLNAGKIIVSNRGLRYGVIVDRLNKNFIEE